MMIYHQTLSHPKRTNCNYKILKTTFSKNFTPLNISVMSDPNVNSANLKGLEIKLGNLIFNRVKEMVCWVQPNGQIFMANDALIKKLGYSKAELLEKFVWEVSSEFPTLVWEEHWANLQKEKFIRFETIWFKKDKTPLAVDVSLHYVEVDGNAFINVIAHNIGKKLEREDLISMTYQTLNNSSDLVIWSKPNGEIFYFNEAVPNLLGYDVDELKSLTGRELIHNYKQENRERAISNLAANKNLKGEVTLKKKDGGIVIAELSASLFEFQGEMISCNIFRDVTAKRAREDRLRELLLENQKLHQELEGEVNYLQEEIQAVTNFKEIITVSPKYQKVLKLIQDVAPMNTTVLVLGETGTGKELLARALHSKSKRANKPLIKINCGALPPNLMESELFGYEKGAFTGAMKAKKGRFELAHKGTIFLDEIGELPLDLQVKLLRVLQEGEFTKLGATQPTQVDVRVIAATNRDLELMIKQKTFREDLYYRLSVFPITNLPLREHKEDIPALTQHFMRKYSANRTRKVTTIPIRSMNKLMAYNYPGNIRELENIVERAVILTRSKFLTLQQWNPQEKKQKQATFKSFDELQREYLIEVLQFTKGKVSGANGAAALLQMNGKTLDSKMRKFDIRRSDFI